ncbi:hypothetical protein C8R45DRAFT_432148 [Mycena sanguinolenta]|nr:hypothetical protein C8R45DRAFT_432148 [Mycena sanguinolenta]
MSAFPQELYETVISLCDQSSLPACSLVCRNWVPSSRHRFFRNLRPLVISPSSLPQVLILVDSPVSTICPYITSLVLEDWGALDSDSKSIYGLLPRITGRMTAVESLGFNGISWEEMVDGALKFLVFYFTNTLKTLELRECPYRTFDSVTDLVESFPLLEKLSLHRLVPSSRSVPCGPGTLEGKHSSPLATARHLRSIHALGSIKSELVRWIMKNNHDIIIEEVSFGPIFPNEVRIIGKFLRSLKNNLKHLTLSGESIPNIHREICLKHNQQLTSIHFANLMLHCRGSAGRASMNWFIYLLHAIRCPSVRSLKLSVCVHSQSLETFEVIDWLAFSACLDKPQFVCLVSLSFSFSLSRHKDEREKWLDGYVEMAEKFVRESLPQFRDTAILDFDFGCPGDTADVEIVDSDDDFT